MGLLKDLKNAGLRRSCTINDSLTRCTVADIKPVSNNKNKFNVASQRLKNKNIKKQKSLKSQDFNNETCKPLTFSGIGSPIVENNLETSTPPGCIHKRLVSGFFINYT